MSKLSRGMQQTLDEAIELLAKKNEDYGGDNLIKVGTQGIASRMIDKVHRLYNLSDGSPINNESLKDTILDIINYALIYDAEMDKLLKPRTTMIYLAGPIDDVDKQEALGWRELMARQLHSIGVSSYNPYSAYTLSIDRNNEFVSKQVVAINKAAIDQCDILVANLSGPGRAFGTIREIEYAKAQGKQVIIIGDVVSLSAYDCLVFKDVLDFYRFMNINIKPSAVSKVSQGKGDQEE